MCSAQMPIKNWVEYYEMYIKMFGKQKLVNKLQELEAVEDEWKNHRDYGSYKNSVNAIKQVLEGSGNK